MTNPSQNMSNLPIETLEARYPIRMEAYGFREGLWRPRQISRRARARAPYRLLAESAVLQLRADRHEHPPYGLFGGGPAASSRNLLEVDGEWRTLPPKVTLDVVRGTALRHEQAGGGGYGDPLERELARIAADLANGKISPAHAAAAYGIAFNDNGEIDAAATQERRNRLRQYAAQSGGGIEHG